MTRPGVRIPIPPLFLNVFNLKRYFPFILIALVFTCGIAAGVLLYRQHLAQNPPVPRFLAAGKPGAIPPHVHGSTGAPVSIEEFGDYECLPCSGAFAILQKIQAEYRDRVSLTFRQFPLKMHAHAMEAALAAEAAGQQGRFWQMHDALYENRAVWTVARADVRGLIDGYASAAGVDLSRFKQDLADPATAKRIADDQERAQSVGVDRTPVIFVNGKLLPFNALTFEGLKSEIEKALDAPAK